MAKLTADEVKKRMERAEGWPAVEKGVADAIRRKREDVLTQQMKDMSVMLDALVLKNPLFIKFIRDNYAAHCAAAACWAGENWSPDKIAKRAFDVADAMMAERKKRSK